MQRDLAHMCWDCPIPLGGILPVALAGVVLVTFASFAWGSPRRALRVAARVSAGAFGIWFCTMVYWIYWRFGIWWSVGVDEGLNRPLRSTTAWCRQADVVFLVALFSVCLLAAVGTRWLAGKVRDA